MVTKLSSKFFLLQNQKNFVLSKVKLSLDGRAGTLCVVVRWVPLLVPTDREFAAGVPSDVARNTPLEPAQKSGRRQTAGQLLRGVDTQH
jgi:hypothetical protein